MDILLAFFIYFSPTLIAAFRKHHNTGSILVINLLLSWTVIGWIIALAMACGYVKNRGSSRD